MTVCSNKDDGLLQESSAAAFRKYQLRHMSQRLGYKQGVKSAGLGLFFNPSLTSRKELD